MRHVELMRFLFVTSFTSQSESLAPESATSTVSTPGIGRSSKLHSVLPRTVPVSANEDSEKKQAEVLYGRRKALAVFAGGSFSFVAKSNNNNANELDMDAFMNSELESDTKNCDPKRDPKCAPELSADEALCKYGQSGAARGEACKRVKETGGELPKANSQGKSLGGAYAM